MYISGGTKSRFQRDVCGVGSTGKVQWLAGTISRVRRRYFSNSPRQQAIPRLWRPWSKKRPISNPRSIKQGRRLIRVLGRRTSSDRLISDEARPPHLAASFISWNIWKVGTNRLEPKETAQRSGPHWGRGRLIARLVKARTQNSPTLPICSRALDAFFPEPAIAPPVGGAG